MAHVTCQCGAENDVPEALYGRAASCGACQRIMRFAVPTAEATRAAGDAVATGAVFGACLVIEAGPAGVGEQIFLADGGPIPIGKLPQQLICLTGPLVSRHHCTLFPANPGRWLIEDHASRNGLFVNGNRAQSRGLSDGDLLDIGEFTLRYLCPSNGVAAVRQAEPIGTEPAPAEPVVDEPQEVVYDFVPEVAPLPAPIKRSSGPSFAKAPGVVCPSCKQTLSLGDKICVDCGIDVKTGRPLQMSHAPDENLLYGNTEQVAKFLSWIMPICLIPVASDAYGKFEPRAMRAIGFATIAITVVVWIINASSDQGEFGPTRNLMLWCGGGDPSPMLTLGIFSLGGQPGEFHIYQLLTNAFLHAGIMHLAGNMVFFFVFANRVNALLGQWKSVAAYLLLAILASLVLYISYIGKPLTPSLGASGAIMGMAGMYFVLMPVSRIYMAFWPRLGIFTGFKRFTKIFSMRGVWMLLLWIAINDVLPTLLGSNDGTAHWAHLGGFMCGAVLALILLITHQVDANGGDILSVTLGPAAWKILGTPAERAKAAHAG